MVYKFDVAVVSKENVIGLVLSGGAARGVAHIGVLKALEELGLAPTVISGTSSGAIIGAFYAAGFSIPEITEIIRNNKIFHLYDFAWSTSGFLGSKANEKMFRKYFKNKTFKDLDIPMYISATDILNGTAVVYSSGDVVKPIVASSSIPVLFEPMEFKGKLLIDGSVVSCFPTEPLVGKCDLLIGSYVNPVNPIKNISGMNDIFDRALHIALYNDVKLKKGFCDLYLEPPALINFTGFDFNRLDELINIGYTYTMGLRKEIQEMVKEKLSLPAVPSV